MSGRDVTIKVSVQVEKETPTMANMYDEMYDDFYATVCPSCKENTVDEYEEKCGYCLLDDFATLYESDIMSDELVGL